MQPLIIEYAESVIPDTCSIVSNVHAIGVYLSPKLYSGIDERTC